MAKFLTKNEIEKDFADTFRSLAYVHSGWQVWSDFVHCAAYAISNAVDPVHSEQREKEYLRIMSRYKETEGQAIARLFALTVEALERDPDQDFLGHLYMNLDMGNKGLGQCFTPFDVCRMMAEINSPNLPAEISKKGWISVMDCCIGGGAMLIAFATECRRQKVNYQNHVLFVGQDIDHTVAMMAYIQLSLIGCPGYIVVDDALTKPLVGETLFAPMERETFVTPMYCSDVWHMRRVWNMADKLFRIAPAVSAESVPAVEEPEAIPAPEPETVIEIKPMSRKEWKKAQISMFGEVGA